jgi:hypothetical protein
MKAFLKRLAARDELPSASSGPELVEGGRVGGRCFFRDLGMGETATLSLSKGMRRGQACPPLRAAQARQAGLPRKHVAEKTSP